MVNVNIPGTGEQDAGELPPLPIGALVAGSVDLMMEAADLPQPRFISVCDTQVIFLQFGPEQASSEALVSWIFRFGGRLTREPHIDEHGSLETLWLLSFGYYGLRIAGLRVHSGLIRPPAF